MLSFLASLVLTSVCHFPGYAVYAWAKKHDAWQNSKAAHVAGGHAEH